MKVTLDIPDSLLLAVKERADLLGLTLDELVEAALSDKLGGPVVHGDYRFDPMIVTGFTKPNVDISNRDALYDILQR